MELGLDTLEDLLSVGEIQQVEDDALVGTEELPTIQCMFNIRINDGGSGGSLACQGCV